MTKRLIDLDDDLLEAARRELNATDVSDTVRVALQQVRQIRRLQAGGLEELADHEQCEGVWR